MTAANPASPAPASSRPAGTPGGAPRGVRPPPPTIDPVRVLRQHAWLLVGAAVVGAVLGTIANFICLYAYPLWGGSVVFEIRPQVQSAKEAVTVEAMGDAGVRSALRGYLDGLVPLSADGLMEAQARRFSICRDWSVMLEPDAGGHDVLLMPVSWQRQFPIDADVGEPERVHRLLAAQSPLLGTAMMGLPGLTVPTGLAKALPGAQRKR